MTEEQIQKVQGCVSSEEILEIAKKEGVELSDGQLEAVAGGCGPKKKNECPKTEYQ